MQKTILTSLLILIITFTNTTTYNSATTLTAEENLTAEDIIAETAIVIDAETFDIYFDKKRHRQMNPASITKLMTALLVLEEKSLTDTLTFSENAVKSLEYGSSSIGIRVEETLTIDQAMHGLLLMSANETANALAEDIGGTVDHFVKAMNDKAIEMGLLNTHFSNPHGLYDSQHYISAYDMAIITSEIIQSDTFMSIMGTSMYQIHETNKCEEIRYLAQQHKMLNDKNDMRIYRDDVIAGKVGYTSESGHTLVTVASNGERTLIVVIMNSNGKDQYTDTEKLIDHGYNAKAIVYEEPKEIETAINETLTPSPLDTTTIVANITQTNLNIQESSDVIALTIEDLVDYEKPDNSLIKNVLLVLTGLLAIIGIGYIIIKDSTRRRRLMRKRDRFHNLKH